MFGLNPFELLIIFAVVVLLFGTKRLPELGSGMGQAISNFRKSYREGLAIDVTPPKVDESHTNGTTVNVTPDSEKKG